ncbi:hypothetical protein ALC53_02233 [Atta colombica]|uniref:Uncharacterized protein n=1 Tax=Atta colombica TaxID=520822 RepID=A0A195BU16_9HYME|nr:hypothetical protein ALC53_02233 [Atta colombica]
MLLFAFFIKNNIGDKHHKENIESRQQ